MKKYSFLLLITILFLYINKLGAKTIIYKPNIKRVSQDTANEIMEILVNELESNNLKIEKRDKQCSDKDCVLQDIGGDPSSYGIIIYIKKIKKNIFLKIEAYDGLKRELIAKESKVIISKGDIEKLTREIARLVSTKLPVKGTVSAIFGKIAIVKNFNFPNIEEGNKVKIYDFKGNYVGYGKVSKVSGNKVEIEIKDGAEKIKPGFWAYYSKASIEKIQKMEKKVKTAIFREKLKKRLKFHIKDYMGWSNQRMANIGIGFMFPTVGSITEKYINCSEDPCESPVYTKAKLSGGLNYSIHLGYYTGFYRTQAEFRFQQYNKKYEDLELTLSLFSLLGTYTYKPLYGLVEPIGVVFIPYGGLMVTYMTSSGLDPRKLSTSHTNSVGLGIEAGIKFVFRYFYITLSIQEPMLLPIAKEKYEFEDGKRKYEFTYHFYNIYLAATFYMSIEDIKRLVLRSRR